MDKTTKKLEKYVLENAKAKNGGVIYDERQRLNGYLSLSTAVIFAIEFDMVMMVLCFIRHDTDKCYPYLAQILVICAGFGLAALGNKEPHLPSTISGRSIDPDVSPKAFAKRVLSCVVDSAVTAAAITGFEIYDAGGISNQTIYDGIIMLVIFMIIDIIVCEIRVRRWRRFQAQLDADENAFD